MKRPEKQGPARKALSLLLALCLCLCLLPAAALAEEPGSQTPEAAEPDTAQQMQEADGPAAEPEEEPLETASAERTYDAGDATVILPVTGGNLSFDTSTGTVTACDVTVTAAEVPPVIGGVSVKAVGQNAFYGCTALTSVTLPSGVTAIGQGAFNGCAALTSVTLPSGLKDIGQSAFYGCKALSSVKLPSGLTAVGQSAFYGCKALSSVKLPSSLTAVGRNAFNGCDSLTKVVYSGGVRDWLEISFSDSCSNPLCCGAALWIGGSRVEELAVPAGMTVVGAYAFNGCSSLKSVTIPSGVTEIGDGAFCDCTALASASIPSGVERIGEAAFRRCTSLKTAKLAAGVKEIGEYAFSGCTAMTSVTLPAGVETIGQFAFNSCSALTAVKIPAGVTRIEKRTFSKCSKLKSIRIPKSVTFVGTEAFQGCNSLTKVEYLGGLKDWVGISFSGVISTPLCSGAELWIGGARVENAVIPSGVTKIGNYAFSGCKDLKSVTIPAGVTDIGCGAFYGCTGLTGMEIPSGVTTIRMSTFTGCTGLKSMTLPSGMTEIGMQAFSGCTGLTSVTIPSSMGKIGSSAFKGCTSLTAVYFLGNPPTVSGAYSRLNSASFEKDIVTLYYTDVASGWPTSSWMGYRTVMRTVPHLTITAQPQDTAVAKAGDTAQVTVEAVGDGLTYQWYLRAPGDADFSKSSNTRDTYRFAVTEASNGRQVYCVVTDRYGKTVRSDVASVFIAGRGPIIVTQPSSVSMYYANSTASVTMEAVGEGLTWQWYLKDPGSRDFIKSSYTTPVCSFTLTRDISGRLLYCVVTDAGGKSVRSDVVAVRLTSDPPVVLEQPRNVTVAAAGDTARVFLKAVGNGKNLTYQWYLKNPGKTEFSRSSVTGPAYSFTVTEASNGRLLYCEVTDTSGKTVRSDVAAVRIAGSGPVITAQPRNVTVAQAGDMAQVTLSAAGEGLTWQWYLKAPGGREFARSSNVTDTYRFAVTEANSGRQVYCVVTDADGKSVQSDVAVVTLAGSGPVITAQPRDVEVAAAGDTARVTVTAVGDGLTYQWYVKNPAAAEFGKSSVTSAAYSFNVSGASNGRQLYCEVTDSSGKTVRSDNVTVTIAGSGPIITAQPQSVSVAAGETARTAVTAIGDGLTYQWYLKNPGKTEFGQSSVTKAAYSTTMTAAADGRQLYCVVTDANGDSVTSNTVTISMTK